MKLPLTALFVDFDAYFASVEQHFRPEFRGKPLAVAPVMAESSCCIAASYEAKALGISTGTPVHEARRICPHIAIVEARPAIYVEMHHRLVACVEDCIHVEQVLSIDEMWCWLPTNWRETDFLYQLAEKIKQRIEDEVGPWIRCSIGMAPNRWLAKMASKMRKPNGTFIIQHDDLPEVLYELDLRDLHGVGSSMELRLHAHGLHSVERLCHASQQQLHSVWGSIEGDRIWMQLRGQEVSDRPTRKRSIGHSHVLGPDSRPAAKAEAVMHKLTQKAGQRLRHYGLLAGQIQLNLQFVSSGYWSIDQRFDPSDDSLLFARLQRYLWRQRPHPNEPILKVSMVLSRLTEAGNFTPSLFKKTDPNRHQLNHAMDQLTQKFGRQAAYLGGAHGQMQAAPMRISFGHIPEVTIEGD